MKVAVDIKTEQQAAALVVEYLTEAGMDVYQEVDLGGCVADIVAVRGREIWIVEVKMSWSLDLLEQLVEHQRWCRGHRLFAAVPAGRMHRQRQRLFLRMGFGSISIRPNEYHERWGGQRTQVEEMAPRTTCKPLPRILAVLDDGHKTHAKAGAPGAAGRWTPFRKTCEALADAVKAKPGMTIKEVIDGLKHHYSSDACARSSLLTWAQAGKVPGVHVVHEGKRLTLWPVGMTPQPRPSRCLQAWTQPALVPEEP
jgi:hypothetical protein